MNSRLGLTLKNRSGHFHPTVFTFRCSAVAYSFSLVSGLHLRFFSLFLSFPESAVWFWWFVWTSVGVLTALDFACLPWVRVSTTVTFMWNTKMKTFVLVPIIQRSPETFGAFLVSTSHFFLVICNFCCCFHSVSFILFVHWIFTIHLLISFELIIIFFIVCCMSAFQSSLRVHGDNIYVRHSNLMLEVGTGIVRWLIMRPTCFCVFWRHQIYNYTVQDCCPLALSGSACMPACVCVCVCLLINSVLRSNINSYDLGKLKTFQC